MAVASMVSRSQKQEKTRRIKEFFRPTPICLLKKNSTASNRLRSSFFDLKDAKSLLEDPFAQMDAQIKRRRTLDAIKRIIICESLNQPTAVIFEDLHWIDGETQALLDLLANSIANSRVLLLVNYRPEYRHEWTNKSYYSQFRLDALGRESAGEMLAALLGEGVELAPKFIGSKASSC